MEFCGTVTAADNGIRALQFPGLDEERCSSVGFDVREHPLFFHVIELNRVFSFDPPICSPPLLA